MNKKIMRSMGFDKEMDLVKKGKCPSCQKEIGLDEFHDELSAKEYWISGLCQDCQDEIFNSKDDVEY